MRKVEEIYGDVRQVVGFIVEHSIRSEVLLANLDLCCPVGRRIKVSGTFVSHLLRDLAGNGS